ncbi:unnamed protein product [Amoebophrya sp. A25]|nr:unnamed protein product [Amoebophrya sp. A25]|eukprot:GSA25T00006890001.1
MAREAIDIEIVNVIIEELRFLAGYESMEKKTKVVLREVRRVRIVAVAAVAS